MLRRPMKAPTDPITKEQLERLSYPVYGSPKLDGFRCTVEDQPYTSTMKPFGNLFVRKELSDPFYKDLDGEIIVGDPTSPDAFHNTSGSVRKFDGEPDFKFYVFDCFKAKLKPYHHRLHYDMPFMNEKRLVILEQRLLKSPEEVEAYEKEMLAIGYEGAMIRSMNGVYKEGRCTFNEMNMFKRKPFVECEALIVGMEEAMENCNEQVVNELGLSKRSHNKENLVPKGTLGNFVLLSPLWSKPFRAAAGKGFTAEMKQHIWTFKKVFIDNHEIVTVKYQKHGSRDAPRLPSVIKLRPLWDVEGEE